MIYWHVEERATCISSQLKGCSSSEPKSMLRRFVRTDAMHPTYKALAELGRAIKTIFLSRYIRSETFRREIHEGPIMVENWNSANGFVFFGMGGEIASNRIADQEISAHALHVLQASPSGAAKPRRM